MHFYCYAGKPKCGDITEAVSDCQVWDKHKPCNGIRRYGELCCDCELILIVVSVEWELVALVTLKPLNILIGWTINSRPVEVETSTLI